ncbi:hypothetical protein ABT124_47110 [Streptomyces sp. NPDC001982]|uniref:hypothetical protein n=1 Tax=Streptomyces sp. NPDC001982 TaxID=3154405 RepID=UPI003324931E
MRHTTTVLIALAALAALAGCSNSSSSDASDSKAASPARATITTSAAPEYTIEDCKAALEQDYAEDNVHDASDEAECKGLTHDEYLEAASGVLVGHRDDILADAAVEAVYDEAWDAVDPDTQQVIFDSMAEEGTEPVARVLDVTITDASIDTEDMAQYLYDKKC